MKSDYSRYALCSCVAAALLVGCGGSQPPISAPDAMPQSRAIATHAQRGGSWMLSPGGVRNASSSYSAILYVGTGNYTAMLSYPSLDQIGEITGPGGDTLGPICPDEPAKSVYGVDISNAQDVVEFAYGGTQIIKTIAAPEYYGNNFCAANQTTGDLAVTYENGQTFKSGMVIVYPSGSKKKPLTYNNSEMMSWESCAYDDDGNLFVDGRDTQNQFLIAELPRGSSTFTNYSLSVAIGGGFLQWDGKQITVAYGPPHKPLTIYRLAFSGSSATVNGKTILKKSRSDTNAWIQGDTVVAGDNKHNSVAFFRYPKSGKSYQSFSGLPVRYTLSFAIASESTR